MYRKNTSTGRFDASEELLHGFIVYILWWLTRISGPNKNCDCTHVKLRHFFAFISYRQSAAERHSPFIIMNFKTFRNGKQAIKFFILHLTAL